MKKKTNKLCVLLVSLLMFLVPPPILSAAETSDSYGNSTEDKTLEIGRAHV